MSNSIEFEPFGEFIVDYAGLAQLPRLGWIGKERDAETDFGNFGVRNYEFGTGRFLSGDALWESYRASSPFQYSANSPLRVSDPSGLSYNFSNFNDKEVQGQLLSDIESKTGLDLSVNEDTGLLEYATDENGNPIVNDAENTSATARKLIVDGVDSDIEVPVVLGSSPNRVEPILEVDKNGNKKLVGHQIVLSTREITGLIAGAVNVNISIMGYAMSFFHESDHTGLGSGNRDPAKFGKVTGPTKKVNKIRSELGMKTRLSYVGVLLTPTGGEATIYIPFDSTALRTLNSGGIPSNSASYVAIPLKLHQ